MGDDAFRGNRLPLFSFPSGQAFSNLLVTARRALGMTDQPEAAGAERGHRICFQASAFGLPRGSFPSCVGKSVPQNLIICPLIKTRSRVKRNLQAANSGGGEEGGGAGMGGAAAGSRGPALEFSLSAYRPRR